MAKRIEDMSDAELDAMEAAAAAPAAAQKPIEQMSIEELDAEIARREAEAAPAELGDSVLYGIPGVGPYIKSIDQFAANNLPQQALGSQIPEAMKNSLPVLNDIGRVGIDAASLGLGDFIADKWSGNQDQARATQEARERLGWGGALATDLVGGSITPTGVVKNAGRVGKVVGHGISGGAQAIADAYMHGERDFSDLARTGLTGVAAGSGMSELGNRIGGWWNARKNRQAAKKTQTFADDAALIAARDAKYKKVRENLSVYRRADLQNLGKDLKTIKLSGDTKGGYGQNTHILRNELLRDLKRSDLTPEKLNELRRHVRQQTDGSTLQQDKDAGRDMIKMIDDYRASAPLYNKTTTGRTTTYTPAPDDIKKTLQEADVLHGQKKRLDVVNKAVKKSERGAHSGRFNPFTPSFESSTVKKFSDVAEKIEEGKIRSRFRPQEIDQIKKIEEGTFLRNVGGYAEPFSWSGKFGGPVAKAAAFVGFLPGATTVSAPIVTGATVAEILSRTGQKVTKNQLEDLRTMVRDPKGVGINVGADPKVVKAIQDRAARRGGSTVRATEDVVDPTNFEFVPNSLLTIDDPGGDGDSQQGKVISEGKNGVTLRMADGSTRTVGKNLIRRQR